MNVGIIGLGVVGEAIRFGFLSLGHSVKCHDVLMDSRIEDVLDTEVCYVCVPTPSGNLGQCDVSIVESVLQELSCLNFSGIVAIKSTISPGSTVRLQKKMPNLTICFVPEFLRERCAIADFMEHHDVCIIGTSAKEAFDVIKSSHGKYPKHFVMIRETEAELCKYFNNAYNATLITLANSFYELSQLLGVDYSVIKDAVVLRDHINDVYMDCNINLRGFGGKCLNKDIKALDYICQKLNAGVDLFGHISNENSKYKTTVFEGMRSE